jgi:predicted outer membrane repeat protein
LTFNRRGEAVDRDHLVSLGRALGAVDSRRRLLGALVGAPLLGAVLDLLDPEEAEAKDRRRRRKRRHKRRKNPGSRKKGCRPKSKIKACAGKCGSVKNRKTCGKRIDCGPCCLPPTEDLQAAIDTASAGATLTLCAGTWEVPATLEITRPVTLVGAGAGQTILDGGNQRRVLQITADVPVTLQALTVTNGKDQHQGSGIFNQGTLLLVDTELISNEITEDLGSGRGGGAIYSDNSVTLRNTVVRENTSSQTDAGGISIAAGTLTLETGSSIVANSAYFDGGGVYLAAGTLVMKSGSVIEENYARSNGGGIYTKLGTVTLEQDSRIFNNEARQWGGGLYIGDGVTTLNAGSQVTHNKASNGGALLQFLGSLTIEEGVLICGNSDQQCYSEVPYGPGSCPSTVSGECP